MNVEAMAQQGLSVLREWRWDTPYRLLASVVALAAVVGAMTGRQATVVLADGARALGADGAAGVLTDVDQWMVTHVRGVLGLVVLLVAVHAVCALAPDRAPIGEHRAASTVLLTAAVGGYAWRDVPVLAPVVLVVTAVLCVVRRRRALAEDLIDGPRVWAARAGAELLLAAQWAPVVVAAWLVGAETREVHVGPALPTGAVGHAGAPDPARMPPPRTRGQSSS